MSTPHYLCHACGSPLSASLGSRLMRCRRCMQDRRVPTDPSLIVYTEARNG